jgi:phosphoribosyl-AMP cyclohydrolase / phosphoribosyl-ATP pyrophosphohydrolase
MNEVVEARTIDWVKGGGLVPAVVQHADAGTVLMLGYMNAEALERTHRTGLVTFWSRSRKALWTKGETSGHALRFVNAAIDCDGDTLLVLARPAGPVCHLGSVTCFGENAPAPAAGALAVLASLDSLIDARERDRPTGSYTTSLFESGVARIAQKVGEEAIETVLAAATRDDDGLLDESADLVYHLMVLLRSRGLGLGDVARVLAERHRR